ncbi:hypothetical protein [Tabrizicola sp.]|uniref:hypothetical protein n=1 Tax=Tabrizicola sp. TaxID=2005166 RepID=UPI002FDDEA4E
MIGKGETVPFGVYLDLEEGALADLERVSKASLELVAAIRDLAEFIDPYLDVKVEIQSSERGSLFLKTIIKIAFDIDLDTDQRKAEFKLTALGAILIGVSVFVTGKIANHYVDMALSAFDREVLGVDAEGRPIDADEDKPRELDRKKVKEIIDGAVRNGVGEGHVRSFYSEIKSDPAINGVGVTFDLETKPEEIVPRSRFAELSKFVEPNKDDKRRSRLEETSVLLVQPRLRVDNRQWRFAAGGIEFAARMEDKKFTSDLLSGRLNVKMVEGVVMAVAMRVDEASTNGVWKVVSRSIEKVHGVKEAESQASLLQFLEDDKNGSDEEEDS